MRNPSSLTAAVVLPPLVGGGLAMLAIYGTGIYGLALFLAVPFLLGWMATAVLRVAIGPQRLRRCFEVSALSVIFLGVLFLVFKAEGALCLLLALPVAVPCLLFGAWAAWRAFHRRDLPPVSSTAALTLLIVVAIAIEPRFQRSAPPLVVSDSILIHASPRETWRSIVALDRVPQPHDWIYRAGVACPQRTRIVAPRANGLRVCTMSTGVVVEQIEVWKPERLLRWRTQSAPPPMKETNPFYANVDPPHLHGYYESPRGEFAIAPAGASGATILTRRTWFRQNLAPSWYWNWWCELAITHIHRTVLEHVRDLAQSKGAIS